MKLKKVQKLINYSDLILVGIGSGVYRKDTLPENLKDWKQIENYLKQGFHGKLINSKINKLFTSKDFFIITTSWDSQLSRYIDKNRLFTPNGNCTTLQCYNACTNDLWEYEDFEIENKSQVCPHCGSPLVMNISTDAYFIREHLDKMETKYHKWIHKNYNNKILLIEIGADESDKKLIKDSFENIATALPNATLLRVNSGDISIPKSIKRKASIKLSPLNFFKTL